MKRHLEILTSSRVNAFRRCKRLHKIKYVDGWRAIRDDENLVIGTLVHHALESWWIETMVEPERARRRLDLAHRLAEGAPANPLSAALLVIEMAPVDLFVRAKAAAMMMGYNAAWAGAGFVALAVEAEFYAPLRNPDTGDRSRLWIRGGKIDVIAASLASVEISDAMAQDYAMARALDTDAIVFFEHKTSSEDVAVGSEYWKRLFMDPQVSNYYAGAAALGFAPSDCIYDVLRKPALRPLKAAAEVKLNKDGTPRAGQRMEDETPGQYRDRCLEAMSENLSAWFVRDSVPRLAADLEANDRDLWAEAKIMRECERQGFAPRNPQACRDYNRLCEFFDPCSGAGVLEDPTRFERVENVHSELSNQPKETADGASADPIEA